MGLALRLSVIFLGGVILLALFPSSHRAMAASMEGGAKNEAVRPLLPMIPPTPILQEESIARHPTSIQALIDAAAPGAVVEVAAGTYTEQLRITKPLTLTAAPGATVLLQGDGSGIAVSVNATYDVVVANLSIKGYARGIVVTNSSNVALYDNGINNSAETPLLIQWSEDCSIIRNIIDHVNPTWTSLVVFSSPGSYIINNSITPQNGHGLTIESSSNVIVEGNFIENIHGSGIDLRNSENNILRVNTIWNSSIFGLELFRSANTTITDNYISNSTNTGLYLYISGNSTVQDNTVINSGWNGIVLRESNNSMVIANYVRRSILPGIALPSSTNCTVTNNLIENEWRGNQLLAYETSMMACEIVSPIAPEPRAGEDMVVKVNISNPFGIGTVLLSYQIGTVWSNQTMEYNVSQTLYTGLIPGQPAGTTIQFQLHAQDQTQNWFRSEIQSYTVAKKASRESLGFLAATIGLALVFVTARRSFQRL